MKHLKYFLNLESMNGNATELENMKQEILREMRKEIAKAKLEIIEGNFSQETEIWWKLVIKISNNCSKHSPLFQLFAKRCPEDKQQQY